MLVLLLCACPAPPASDDTSSDTDQVQDTGDDGGTDWDDSVDIDDDGFILADDCDDYDPQRYPGAPERWNNEDDDCDGRVDADGRFTGIHEVTAVAVFEGTPYTFDMLCPATVTRATQSFTMSVVCEPDPDEPLATQLLGSQITVEPDGNFAQLEHWDGNVTITSSDGWDTTGTGSLQWTSVDAVTLQTQDSNFSLTWNGDGALLWDGE